MERKKRPLGRENISKQLVADGAFFAQHSDLMKQKSAGQEEEMFAKAIRKAGTDGKLAVIHLKLHYYC